MKVKVHEHLLTLAGAVDFLVNDTESVQGVAYPVYSVVFVELAALSLLLRRVIYQPDFVVGVSNLKPPSSSVDLAGVKWRYQSCLA